MRHERLLAALRSRPLRFLFPIIRACIPVRPLDRAGCGAARGHMQRVDGSFGMKPPDRRGFAMAPQAGAPLVGGPAFAGAVAGGWRRINLLWAWSEAIRRTSTFSAVTGGHAPRLFEYLTGTSMGFFRRRGLPAAPGQPASARRANKRFHSMLNTHGSERHPTDGRAVCLSISRVHRLGFNLHLGPGSFAVDLAVGVVHLILAAADTVGTAGYAEGRGRRVDGDKLVGRLSNSAQKTKKRPAVANGQTTLQEIRQLVLPP